jgi:hypothetical protein
MKGVLMVRRTAIAFAAILLFACTVASAESPRKANVENGTRVTDTAENHDLARFIVSLRNGTPYKPATAAVVLYCTRAIDIGGVFCAIGCPSECQCSSFGWFSQCCCDAAT